MGLDMYLTKKHYIANRYRKPEERVIIIAPEDQKGVLFKTDKINNDRIDEITEEVCYWRKANAIHAWFVENVQDGNDDCKSYPVSKEKLRELLDTVNKVLDSIELIDKEIVNGYTYANGVEQPVIEKGCAISDPAIARQLLPTQEGFFFGGTDYDQYYYDDLVQTKNMLEKVLAEEDGEFYYQSSW